jgi:hypothetical protein
MTRLSMWCAAVLWREGGLVRGDGPSPPRDHELHRPRGVHQGAEPVPGRGACLGVDHDGRCSAESPAVTKIELLPGLKRSTTEETGVDGGCGVSERGGGSGFDRLWPSRPSKQSNIFVWFLLFVLSNLFQSTDSRARTKGAQGDRFLRSLPLTVAA